MRKLCFTTDSPFARAARILLAEKCLGFEREEAPTLRSSNAERSTPALQVPALEGGEVRLWASAVIIEYLMAAYPNMPAPPAQPPFAADYVRDGRRWTDLLAQATLRMPHEHNITISYGMVRQTARG